MKTTTPRLCPFARSIIAALTACLPLFPHVPAGLCADEQTAREATSAHKSGATPLPGGRNREAERLARQALESQMEQTAEQAVRTFQEAVGVMGDLFGPGGLLRPENLFPQEPSGTAEHKAEQGGAEKRNMPQAPALGSLVRAALAVAEYQNRLRNLEENHGRDSVLAMAQRLDDLARHLDMFGGSGDDPATGEALRLLRDQLREGRETDAPSALLTIARHAQAMGDAERARALLERTVEQARAGADAALLAEALEAQGAFLADMGEDAELDRAQALLEEARAVAARGFGGGQFRLRRLDGLLGRLHLRRGDHVRARDAFRAARDAIGEARVDLAEGAFEQARQRAEGLWAPLKATQAARLIVLGLAEEGLGRPAGAAEHFQAAIRILEEEWSALLPQEKSTFLDGTVEGIRRVEAYAGMIRILAGLGEDDPQAAARGFEYVERSKSRALLSLLARKNALAGIEAEPATANALQEARERVRNLFAAELRLTEAENRRERLAEADFAEVRRERAAARARHDAFFAALESERPELASLFTLTEPVDAAEIRKLLAPNEALVEYACFGPDTRVWVLRRDSALVKRLDIGEAEIDRALQGLGAWERAGKRSRGVVLAEAAEPAATPAGMPDELVRLHRALIEPIRPWIADAEQLVIVPHGALHRLPFAALRDGAESLIDRFAVAQAPSASVLRYMAAKRKPLGKPNRGRFLAFADPESERGPLPFAEAEVRAVAPLFDGQRIFAGPEATESRVKASVAGQNVVHFACHGAFDGSNPLNSALFLGKDEHNDGRLELREIFQLDLKAAGLVTLSACETATSRVRGGDDVVGLSRGFLYAGSPSLLAALWPIDDRSVSLLMRDFYQNWRVKGMSKAQALRRAQRALKADPRYASPYFWAPFVLIGDWKE